MKRPTLFVCRRCEDEDGAAVGDALFRRVKALRKEQGLKAIFRVEDAGCLGLCRAPCAVRLAGKKRSTYTRGALEPSRDAQTLVDAARAYARLGPGGELSERELPGDADD